MAHATDIARLNVLLETLIELASVRDVNAFVLSLGARARFLVPVSRCVMLLGDSIAEPTRVAIVRERGVPSNAGVHDLSPLERGLATTSLDTLLPAVDDLRRPQVACYPITSLGTLFGTLIFTASATYSMSDLRTVQVLTDACAAVLGRIEASAASRRERAAHAAIKASEAQRRRISRELHDGMGQDLAALVLGLKSAGDAAADADLRNQLRRLQATASRVSQDMHHIALELRPGVLDDRGLEVALSNYVEEWSRRHGVSADFQRVGPKGERFPPYIESTIYRVVQEALTNVSKHARATSVNVLLQRHAHEIVTIVEDDGCGFDVAAVEAPAGLSGPVGLLGMQERAVLVGGTCQIESHDGGTSVFVRIPLPVTEDAADV